MKHKIKSQIIYPLVRLPQSEVDLAGETAYVFKKEHNGKSVYVITLREKFNCERELCNQREF